MADINFNGTTTNINTVSFNGNSDINFVNLNGSIVWTKAPTALQVAQALVADTGITSTNRHYTRTDTYAKMHGFGEQTGATTKTHDTNFSALTGAMASSPYVTAIAITNGTDTSGGNIGQFSYVPVGGSSTNVSTSTEVAYSSGTWLSAACAQINTSLPNVDSYSFAVSSVANNAPIEYISMILPNKWTAELVDTGSGSTTLASGEILVVHNGAGGPDDYYSGWDTQNTVTRGSNSVVYRHQHWWYLNNSIGIFANNTASSQSISWVQPDPAYIGEGAPTGCTTRVLKLKQVGI